MTTESTHMMNTRSKKDTEDTPDHTDTSYTKDSVFETLDKDGNLTDLVVPDDPPTTR